MSNASDSSIKYEPFLVQALLLHVLETRLQDEAVRAKLRPLLEVASVTDEQLMDRINTIISVEIKDENKMGAAGKKGPRVRQVGTASADSNPTQFHSNQASPSENGKAHKKETKPNSLVKALEAVQSNLPSLKERFDKAHTPVERGTHWQ